MIVLEVHMTKTITKVFRNKKWVKVEFKTIKKGDKFRIIDKDTKKVITEGIALGDVFLDDDEVWKVKVGE